MINSSYNNCLSCIGSDPVKNTLIQETKTLESHLKELDLYEQKLTKRLEVLFSSISFMKANFPESKTQESASTPEISSMKQLLMHQKLPSSLFSVICRQHFSLTFLLQSGLMPLHDTCECGRKMEVVEFPNGHLYYICSCSIHFPMLKNSFWAPSSYRNPQHILTSIVMFLSGIKEYDILRLVGGDSTQLQFVLKTVLKVISEGYLKSLPKFRGVVEIDESAFKRKRATRNHNQINKWVFGLYERERRLVYMEIVPDRHAATLLPIVQRICEPGTTIISDQWAAYNKLEEIGFPHYTVDHSRFFVNPNSREIHTQNIEISWGWAKYEIRRQNRALYNLQQYIHMFCWKRQFKGSIDKETETAEVVKAFCELFKKFQEEQGKEKIVIV